MNKRRRFKAKARRSARSKLTAIVNGLNGWKATHGFQKITAADLLDVMRRYHRMTA